MQWIRMEKAGYKMGSAMPKNTDDKYTQMSLFDYVDSDVGDEDEFRMIRPEGGGGTSFEIIFDHIRDFMADDPPVSVIILTDGWAPFPDVSAAMDIPVLWVLTSEDVQPPWGKTARIAV